MKKGAKVSDLLHVNTCFFMSSVRRSFPEFISAGFSVKPAQTADKNSYKFPYFQRVYRFLP